VLAVAARGKRPEQGKPQHSEANEPVTPGKADREKITQENLRAREQYQSAEQHHDQNVLESTA
jgi:hypothetical protein